MGKWRVFALPSRGFILDLGGMGVCCSILFCTKFREMCSRIASSAIKPDRYDRSKWNHRTPRLTICVTHGFRIITWATMENIWDYGAKFRSGNGNENRWNSSCGELLLSKICTRSFGKNSLLHLSKTRILFIPHREKKTLKKTNIAYARSKPLRK